MRNCPHRSYSTNIAMDLVLQGWQSQPYASKRYRTGQQLLDLMNNAGVCNCVKFAVIEAYDSTYPTKIEA